MKNQNKEAFVYCWTDHKNKMLYVGSHKGSIDDGYICSSKHMISEYKKRPQDFTRQIIAEGSLDDIRKLETKILQTVNARLNESFYNKHQNDGFFFDGWKSGEFTEEHRKKMSIAQSKRKRTKEHLDKLHEGRRNSKNSPEHIAAIKKKNSGKNNPMYGKIPWNKGKPCSEETKQKIKDALLKRKGGNG